uniref:Putative zinc transporter n=1 Tax=Corethrella appendiculata TaxID=1370023 RepID=U5EX14_9DIPT
MNISTAIMDETLIYIYNEILNYMPEYIKQIEYTPWVFSLLGSALIGLSGILPLAVIPDTEIDNSKKDADNNPVKFKDPSESKTLKVLLSFAVGGLLGDVFLHLLPEAWNSDAVIMHNSTDKHSHPSMRSGLWVLSGVLIFTVVEKLFSGYANADENNPQPKCVEIANCLLRRSGGKLPKNTDHISCAPNGSCDIEDVPNGCFLAEKSKNVKAKKEQPKKVAGYLNLMANSIDNFTHGLAVAGSFLVSFRHGILATFAILLHEIPHEVGDFAILLRSGFSRWDAAKAQLLTASAGMLGALVAIFGTGVTSALEAKTSWIMPFTAGGFLHIALVTVLPDLLEESDPKESIKQFCAILVGISVMASLTVLME